MVSSDIGEGVEVALSETLADGMGDDDAFVSYVEALGCGGVAFFI